MPPETGPQPALDDGLLAAADLPPLPEARALAPQGSCAAVIAAGLPITFGWWTAIAWATIKVVETVASLISWLPTVFSLRLGLNCD